MNKKDKEDIEKRRTEFVAQINECDKLIQNLMEQRRTLEVKRSTLTGAVGALNEVIKGFK